MPKDKKTKSEHILDALLTGKTLLLSDINRMVSEASHQADEVDSGLYSLRCFALLNLYTASLGIQK